jgi:hypothetical protein
LSVYEALKLIGRPAKYLLEKLLEAQASLAYCLRTVLTEQLGPQKAIGLISQIWGLRTEITLDRYIKELGLEKGKTDLRDLGRLAKLWWEGDFVTPYNIIENTPERHVGQIKICPFWEAIKRVLGEENARKMYTRKAMVDTTIKEFQGLARALGIPYPIDVSVEKLICAGDDVDLFIIKRRVAPM